MRRWLVALAPVLLLRATVAASGQLVPELPEDRPRLREMQTRIWQAEDPDLLLRAVLSAMQDLEFVVDDAEVPLGLAWGTKFHDYDEGRLASILGSGLKPVRVVRLTVSVRPRAPGRFAVRACAYAPYAMVDDPDIYRQFFDALGRVGFLPAE